MTDDLDTIERQIDIDASAERVWLLVSEPGWWINDGVLVEHTITHHDDHDVVVDEVHGPFRIRTELLEPPRHAAFRWLGDEDASTLVRFWIDDRPSGGVTLRVVETGFTTYPEHERKQRHEDNVEGWEQELAIARARFVSAG